MLKTNFRLTDRTQQNANFFSFYSIDNNPSWLTRLKIWKYDFLLFIKSEIQTRYELMY